MVIDSQYQIVYIFFRAYIEAKYQLFVFFGHMVNFYTQYSIQNGKFVCLYVFSRITNCIRIAGYNQLSNRPC